MSQTGAQRENSLSRAAAWLCAMSPPGGHANRRHPAHAKVRLTNTLDELRAREGKLSRSEVRSVVVEAEVDDEPVWSGIPQRLVRRLGLATQQTWIGRQAFGVEFKIGGRTTSESTLIGGRKVLVGRTVCAGTDLVIDALAGRLIPNPKHPDGPVLRV